MLRDVGWDCETPEREGWRPVVVPRCSGDCCCDDGVAAVFFARAAKDFSSAVLHIQLEKNKRSKTNHALMERIIFFVKVILLKKNAQVTDLVEKTFLIMLFIYFYMSLFILIN